ncbi:MAG: tRNA pseudouridine(55) synthase TruB [Acidobacteriia bacterium 12-62-4]|nr:MAG: tRNA pseudouridine(55) synthase TruB [Acidobacteriia bacterium 12-62-4]
MDGVIVVDKPTEWTSHDVVGKMRRLAQTKRVGHLGTLDPMATGVLPLVLNRATRLAQFFTKADKVYEATIRFGFATNSYDADGEATTEPVAVHLDAAALERALDPFRGDIVQMPPAVSAKKINGVPAYKLARQNKPVELKAVPVTIHELQLLECAGDSAKVRVHCSTGTYIRSLAHDLGVALGCGAHLSVLRRTRAGMFTLADARTLEQLADPAVLAAALIPANSLLPEFPAERVDAVTAGFIRQGRNFRVNPFRVQQGAPYVRAVDDAGALVAIGEIKLPNLYHPFLVL